MSRKNVETQVKTDQKFEKKKRYKFSKFVKRLVVMRQKC